MKPEKDALTKVLTYHVVAGRLSVLDLKKRIKAGSGQTELKTVSGSTLIVAMQAKNIALNDEKGGVSTVTIPNVFQSNGVAGFCKMGLTRWFGWRNFPGGSALSFAPSNSHSQCANEELLPVYAGALRIADKPGADRISQYLRVPRY